MAAFIVMHFLNQWILIVTTMIVWGLVKFFYVGKGYSFLKRLELLHHIHYSCRFMKAGPS